MSAIFQEPDIPEQQAGQVWPHRPSHWRPCHHHSELELNLVTQGRARVRLGQTVHDVSSGDLIWLVPGEAHELVSAEPGFFMWVAAFSHDLREAVERRLRSSSWPPSGARIVRLEPPRCASLGERLEASRELGDRQALLGTALEQAARLTSSAGSAELSRIHAIIRRAIGRLTQDPTLSRSSLAEDLAMNQEHLSRLFTAELGVGLAAYRNRIRLARSVALLTHGGRSVTAAALESGFGSYPQFHRSFVREFGMAPIHWLEPGEREKRMQLVGRLGSAGLGLVGAAQPTEVEPRSASER